MTRLWTVLSSLFVVIAILVAMIVYDRTNREAAQPIDAMLSWPPSSADLVRESGAAGTDLDSAAGKAARNKFADLFKNRYRKHTPQIAIGIKFHWPNKIDLLTPARMEPWNMDKLAMRVYSESQQAFGHTFDIDIFVTYIGAMPLKMGELRTNPETPGKVSIVHVYQGKINSAQVEKLDGTARVNVATATAVTQAKQNTQPKPLIQNEGKSIDVIDSPQNRH